MQSSNGKGLLFCNIHDLSELLKCLIETPLQAETCSWRSRGWVVRSLSNAYFERLFLSLSNSLISRRIELQCSTKRLRPKADLRLIPSANSHGGCPGTDSIKIQSQRPVCSNDVRTEDSRKTQDFKPRGLVAERPTALVEEFDRGASYKSNESTSVSDLRVLLHRIHHWASRSRGNSNLNRTGRYKASTGRAKIPDSESGELVHRFSFTEAK